MNSKKTLWFALFAAAVLIVATFSERNVLNTGNGSATRDNPSSQYHVLNIGDAAILVSIADTPALQERGLSGTPTLPEKQGMYFVFDKAGFYPFWMKEMNFPIDIIWLGDDARVVDITANALPSSFPETFVSKTPARYVLEVNAGFAERHGVKIGDSATLASLPPASDSSSR